MGYTTDFQGSFSLDREMTEVHANYINAFSHSRRMARDAEKAEKLPDPVRIAAGLPIGVEGGYFVGTSEINYGQDHDVSVLRGNDPPEGQPSLWCQWVVSDDRLSIEWDGGEKFYDYVEWIKYIIENFLKPWGYVLDGVVRWRGEDFDDMGSIIIGNNEVETEAR